MMHDAADRLWSEIDAAHALLRVDRLQLGNLFLQLRNLYSDRNSGGNRLSSGHGTFEEEIRKRGYKPRRVREWITDYEVVEGLRPAAESTAAKREARRGRPQSAEYKRGFSAGQKSKTNIFEDLIGSAFGVDSDWSAFAKLLSHAEAKSAFRAAAMRLHPDRGGSVEDMTELNQLWEALEPMYLAKEVAPTESGRRHAKTVQ
jgi:hypothetical protein